MYTVSKHLFLCFFVTAANISDHFYIYMILLNKKHQWLDLLRIFSYVLLPPNTLTSAKKQSNRLSKNVPLLMRHVLFPPCQLMYHVKFLWVQTELIMLWSSI